VTIRGTYTTGHGAGTTDFPPDPRDLEQLTVHGVQATVAPRGADGSGTWSVALTFPAPGDVTLAPTIAVLDARQRRQIATLSGKVTVARPPLALTVVSPLASATLTYQLHVDTSSPIGVGLVACSTDGAKTWPSLVRQNGVRWSGPMQLTMDTAGIPAAAVKTVTVGIGPTSTSTLRRSMRSLPSADISGSRQRQTGGED
jgi:hypothetical protein